MSDADDESADDEICLHTDEWLKERLRLRQLCARCRERARQAHALEPAIAHPEETGGPPLVVANGLQLQSAVKWKVFPLPENPELALQDATWPRDSFCLSDAGVIIVILTRTRAWRTAHCPYGFEARGDIRRKRVSLAPTLFVRAHNIRWYLVFRGVYALTGGSTDAGWLINCSQQGICDTGIVDAVEPGTRWQASGMLLG